MVRKEIMLIAGEPSGDARGAELVQALRAKIVEAEFEPNNAHQPLHATLAPLFFGAGGPRMAKAGVELLQDLTQHSVVGIVDVLKRWPRFRRFFSQLRRAALSRQPDVIVFIDFSVFNLALASSIRRWIQNHQGPFFGWRPKLVYYVSPQVWASRARRALQMQREIDLVLSIVPFEKQWYAKHAPDLRLEFVGHPLLDQYPPAQVQRLKAQNRPDPANPLVLLLPGSRASELKRHLPIMMAAAAKIRARVNCRVRAVLPQDQLAAQARAIVPDVQELEVDTRELSLSLAEASVAIASTGTVTLECAMFEVPTVTLYTTSTINYQVGKRLITVPFLAMPNLIAEKEVYPEFIQAAASPEAIAAATLDLLQNPARRQRMEIEIRQVISALGLPGAADRAADHIVGLLRSDPKRLEKRVPVMAS